MPIGLDFVFSWEIPPVREGVSVFQEKAEQRGRGKPSRININFSSKKALYPAICLSLENETSVKKKFIPPCARCGNLQNSL